MERCPHLRQPSPAALLTLRDPTAWSCRVCASTDGVWVCLGCGHVGCGRRAHLPALGGGHSRHHYQTSLHGTAVGVAVPNAATTTATTATTTVTSPATGSDDNDDDVVAATAAGSSTSLSSSLRGR